jgi:hypothetical protein
MGHQWNWIMGTILIIPPSMMCPNFRGETLVAVFLVNFSFSGAGGIHFE